MRGKRLDTAYRGRRLNTAYAFGQLKKNWRDWRWYYFQFTNHILPKYFSIKNYFKSSTNSVSIVEEDWDNLVILDACRYDVFKEKYKKYNLHGNLEKYVSKGSSTVEFLIKNFEGGKFPDIIYITANPYVYTIIGNLFYKTVHLWRDNWDSEKGTVMPEQVVEKTLEIQERYPRKRLIIHFMQPHSPYVGKYKREGNFWQLALKEGKEEAMRAYRSNLDLVLPHVEHLVNKLRGKTVVTADHGEACGEEAATPLKIPIYGHPNGVHIPVLLEVPWLVVDKPRKKIKSSEMNKTSFAIEKLKKEGKL